MATVNQPRLRVAGNPKQIQFWNSPAAFRAFVGGIRSGKSMASAVEIIRQPKSVGAIVAPTYATVARGILALLLEHFRPFIKDIHKKDATVELIHGTKIYLVSAERIDNFRGPHLDWFCADEAGYFSDSNIWTTMLGRLAASKNPKAWITTSPNGLNWLYDEFVVNHQSIDPEANNYDPNYKLIHASIEDNFAIPRENIRLLRDGMSSALATQELDGLFVDLKNARVQRSWFKYGLPPADKVLPITIGVDLASSLKTTADFTALVVSAFDKEAGIRYVLDFYQDRLTFHQTQNIIKSLAANWHPTRINVEKVGYQQAVIQELIRTTSLPVKAYSPRGDKVERFLPVEGQLEHGLIFFAPGFKRDLEDQLLSFPNSKHDDLIDALVMSLDIPNPRKSPIKLIYS